MLPGPGYIRLSGDLLETARNFTAGVESSKFTSFHELGTG